MTELNDLAGHHVLQGIEVDSVKDTYGEDAGRIIFRIDGVTYAAIEDPEDGYRSCLKELEIVDALPKTSLPDIPVVATHSSKGSYQDADILTFVDAANGKEVLKLGTDNLDDYYPYCVLEYTPENLAVNAGSRLG